jgi:hypothetical protein
MEQMINGQIGQPAACMMENNGSSLARCASQATRDYGLHRAAANSRHGA